MNKDRPEVRSGVEGSEPGAVKVGAAADTVAADAAVVGTAVVGTAARSIEAETRWAERERLGLERVTDAAWHPLATSAAVPQPLEYVNTRARVGLAGNFERLDNPSLMGLADALLKSPANVVYQLNHSRSSLVRFVLLVVGSLMLTGVVVASFSGGYQYLAVPLKLALGFVFGAALCLPSLYIFSCLSGTQHTLRNVTAALLMGMGVQGLLLIGFAPIAWIFSQSTSSPSFMGFLYLVMLLVSAGFGLALTGRVLAATGTRARILWIWNMMFVVVMLQLTTNMRPIVGKFEGVGIAEKEFFLSHWGRSLSDEM